MDEEVTTVKITNEVKEPDKEFTNAGFTSSTCLKRPSGKSRSKNQKSSSHTGEEGMQFQYQKCPQMSIDVKFQQDILPGKITRNVKYG